MFYNCDIHWSDRGSLHHSRPIQFCQAPAAAGVCVFVENQVEGRHSLGKRPPQLGQMRTTLLILRVSVVAIMFLLTLDWALGEGTHHAWLAVLGVVMTLLEIFDRRIKD